MLQASPRGVEVVRRHFQAGAEVALHQAQAFLAEVVAHLPAPAVQVFLAAQKLRHLVLLAAAVVGSQVGINRQLPRQAV